MAREATGDAAASSPLQRAFAFASLLCMSPKEIIEIAGN
jgi:hypothetical protein